MSLAGIFDGQIMKAELRLNPLQELIAGLEQANPDDVPGPTRPLARFLDGYVFDSASAAVDARGNDPGFEARRRHRAMLSSSVHVFQSGAAGSDYSQGSLFVQSFDRPRFLADLWYDRCFSLRTHVFAGVNSRARCMHLHTRVRDRLSRNRNLLNTCLLIHPRQATATPKAKAGRSGPLISAARQVVLFLQFCAIRSSDSGGTNGSAPRVESHHDWHEVVCLSLVWLIHLFGDLRLGLKLWGRSLALVRMATPLHGPRGGLPSELIAAGSISAGLPFLKVSTSSISSGVKILRKTLQSRVHHHRGVRVEVLAATAQPASCSPCRNAANSSLSFGIVSCQVHEHADTPHRLPLLRARRERPRHRRTAEQRNEFAPPHHSITSSARASSVGGTVTPMALAALRLITSS